MILSTDKISQIADLLLTKKIGVLPTDTIYGIHCLAKDSDLFEKIIDIKGKDKNTPMITLISDIKDLVNYDVNIDAFAQEQINTFWPGPNTLIFETSTGETKSFRFPKNEFLIEVLNKTGPLISTSANLHGKPHSIDVTQAIEYFGDTIDFYVDGGVLNNASSSIYKIIKGSVEKIR